jgi:hypothetical protein
VGRDSAGMFLLLIALAASWPPQVWWWKDFQTEYKRCGVTFNVDGPGPAGDGILIAKDYSGLIVSRNTARAQKPIKCIVAWSKKHKLPVRYNRN